MPRHAVERLADRTVTLDAREANGRVLVRVTDNGPGVPPAKTQLVFDPFFTIKMVGTGLGLGWSISYNIEKDFGGDLRFEPGPTGGAMFILELAAAR